MMLRIDYKRPSKVLRAHERVYGEHEAGWNSLGVTFVATALEGSKRCVRLEPNLWDPNGNYIYIGNSTCI